MPEDALNHAILLGNFCPLEGSPIKIALLLPAANGGASYCTGDKPNLHLLIGLGHLDAESASQTHPSDGLVKVDRIHCRNPFIGLIKHEDTRNGHFVLQLNFPTTSHVRLADQEIEMKIRISRRQYSGDECEQ